MKKKGGRPTDDPKPNKLSFRLSDETMEILDAFCAQEKLSRADGVRAAVKLLKEKLN